MAEVLVGVTCCNEVIVLGRDQLETPIKTIAIIITSTGNSMFVLRMQSLKIFQANAVNEYKQDSERASF